MLERLLPPGAGFRRRVAALVALLEAERVLIRRGDLAGLAALEDRRGRLVEALAASDPPPGPESEASLAHLRREAERNRRLLEAFRDGLTRAGAEARRLARNDRAIGLYGPKGARLAEPPAPSGRERRA